MYNTYLVLKMILENDGGIFPALRHVYNRTDSINTVIINVRENHFGTIYLLNEFGTLHISTSKLTLYEQDGSEIKFKTIESISR